MLQCTGQLERRFGKICCKLHRHRKISAQRIAFHRWRCRYGRITSYAPYGACATVLVAVAPPPDHCRV